MVTSKSWNQNLKLAHPILAKLKDNFEIEDNCVNETLKIYQSAFELGMTRNYSVPVVMGCSFYYSCRKLGYPVSIKTISKQIEQNKKQILKCYGLLLKHLELNAPISTPTQCLEIILSKIVVDDKIKNKTIKLLQAVEKKNLPLESAPMSIAAGAFYLILVINGIDKTQLDITHATGLSSNTIQRAYKITRNIIGEDWNGLNKEIGYDG